MPKPVELKLILKVLKKHGFVKVSQKGSHAKYRKKNKKKYTVILKTTKKEIPYGTFRAILTQAGLTERDFE